MLNFTGHSERWKLTVLAEHDMRDDRRRRVEHSHDAGTRCPSLACLRERACTGVLKDRIEEQQAGQDDGLEDAGAFIEPQQSAHFQLIHKLEDIHGISTRRNPL